MNRWLKATLAGLYLLGANAFSETKLSSLPSNKKDTNDVRCLVSLIEHADAKKNSTDRIISFEKQMQDAIPTPDIPACIREHKDNPYYCQRLITEYTQKSLEVAEAGSHIMNESAIITDLKGKSTRSLSFFGDFEGTNVFFNIYVADKSAKIPASLLFEIDERGKKHKKIRLLDIDADGSLDAIAKGNKEDDVVPMAYLDKESQSILQSEYMNFIRYATREAKERLRK